jgi:hypothetical protein
MAELVQAENDVWLVGTSAPPLSVVKRHVLRTRELVLAKRFTFAEVEEVGAMIVLGLTAAASFRANSSSDGEL